MQKNPVFRLTTTAVFMALVLVATMVVQIPIPLGYAHLGDAVILLSALVLSRRYAVFAASVGSMLADFITGFAIWCVPTLIIKSILTLIAIGIFRSSLPQKRLLGGFFSMLFMTIGYTVAGAVLFDSAALGLASAPGLAMEGVVNIVAFLFLAKLLSPVLKKIDFHE